jgi:hypothetical protein
MLVENAVLQSLFVILSNLQLIMNLFAFSLKFRAYTRFRALLEIPRANTNSAQFRARVKSRGFLTREVQFIETFINSLKVLFLKPSLFAA